MHVLPLPTSYIPPSLCQWTQPGTEFYGTLTGKEGVVEELHWPSGGREGMPEETACQDHRRTYTLHCQPRFCLGQPAGVTELTAPRSP